MPTHIVKTKEAHDFLALVPQLVGFTPENSVVLVAFRGNRTCGALRFNLPAADVSVKVEKRIATSLIGTLCKIPGADAVVPVVYTADSVAARRGLPHARFADSLAKRAELSGFLVRDALCVGSDAWGSYLDPQCPAGGHPLSQIAASSVHADVPEAVRQAVATLRSGTELPAADLAMKERVGAQYRRLLKGFGPTGVTGSSEALVSRIGEIVDPVELAEIALGWDPRALSGGDAAALLYLVQSPGIRDQVMVQFAFGRQIGEEAHEANLRYWDLQRRTGLSMDEIVALDLAMDAVTARDAAAAAAAAAADDDAFDDADPADIAGAQNRRRGLRIGELLVGNTPVPPDPERCERAITLLKMLVAVAPRSTRPAPLCILAWLSWAMGRGSVAGIFLDKALVIDPGYSMAQVLDTLLGSGHLPEWAFRALDHSDGAADGADC